MAGLDTLVVSVYHPMFRNFDSEFVDSLERADAGAPGDEIVRESDFEQDIVHCDEVVIALLFGHQDVCLAGTVRSWEPPGGGGGGRV